MARSGATTVAEYLDELPADRREVISSLREFILEHLPSGYQDSMSWGMISYEVPLERYGKSCTRFRRIEDLPLEVIGRAVARTSVEDLIAFYKTGRNRRG